MRADRKKYLMISAVVANPPTLPWPLLYLLVSAMQPIVVSLRDDKGEVFASITKINIRALEKAITVK